MLQRRRLPIISAEAIRRAGVQPLVPMTDEPLVAFAVSTLRLDFVGTAAEKETATFDETAIIDRVEMLRAAQTRMWNAWVDRAVRWHWWLNRPIAAPQFDGYDSDESTESSSSQMEWIDMCIRRATRSGVEGSRPSPRDGDVIVNNI